MSNNNGGRFRKKKVCFTQVSNSVARDNSISLKAKGLYLLIQSYITLEDFTIYKNFLLKQCKEGRDSFQNSWNELKKNGYLKQYKIKDENGKFYYEYDLLDIPEVDITVETTGIEENKKEDKTKKVKDKKELHTENPYMDENKKSHILKTRSMDNPDSENPGYINNTNCKNTNYNNTNSIINPNKKKTYCSEEDKEIVDRMIEDLKLYTLGTFSRWDYRKFLNASFGDVELVKYVYDNVLEQAKEKDIKNLVRYIVKSIDNELKNN